MEGPAAPNPCLLAVFTREWIDPRLPAAALASSSAPSRRRAVAWPAARRTPGTRISAGGAGPGELPCGMGATGPGPGSLKNRRGGRRCREHGHGR